jgi:hypothetical protein
MVIFDTFNEDLTKISGFKAIWPLGPVNAKLQPTEKNVENMALRVLFTKRVK